MNLKLLDCVVLKHDLPEAKLRAGDLGTVVEIYSDEDFEVEFVTAAGSTLAVLTLSKADVREVERADILAVRSSIDAAA